MLYRLSPTRFQGEPTKVPPYAPSFTKCGGNVNYKSLVWNFVALCHSDRAAKLRVERISVNREHVVR